MLILSGFVVRYLIFNGQSKGIPPDSTAAFQLPA